MISEGPRALDLRGVDVATFDFGGIAEHLRTGGVVAYPTETVYGFGGLCSPTAVDTLRSLKRRQADKPFIVVIRGVGDAERLSWTDEARELARIFWPGALTLVLRDPEGVFPAGVRSSSETVAVRVSPHPLVRRLLEAVGAPLTSTSANSPGEPPTSSGADAFEIARSLGAGSELWVLDVGVLPQSGPSTVVDCTGAVPVVVRAGSVPVERLRCAVPEIHER
jgi:L-threonylcarbamoyladenylate synthase